MKRTSLFIILCALALNLFAQKSASQSWYVKDYTEQVARSYLDNATYLLPIEGIWQSSDGYKYAIEKDVEGDRKSVV